jgi:hypothetical protein
MALIFRSMLEVDEHDFVALAPDLFQQWLRGRPGLDDFELRLDGERHVPAAGYEVMAVNARQVGSAAFRATFFENREREQVKTTFTAISTHKASWSWVDLERWTDEAWRGSWVPYSPGVVGGVLRAVTCHRGPTGLDNHDHLLRGDQGALLASQVLDETRIVPIVVATPTSSELENGLSPAQQRARELQRRLAGVAPVYLLGAGAVEAFSKAMRLAAGDDMDVHSGAVRTYMPGAGAATDVAWRHRYERYYRLQRGPADRAALLVAPRLVGAATHQLPPPAWLELRELPEFAPGGLRDRDLEDLVELAEDEREEFRRRTGVAEQRAEESETLLELEREAQSELLAQIEDMSRRLRYAEGKLREHGDQPEPPPEPAATFELCEDVVGYVSEHLALIEFGPRVPEGASNLDEHAEAVWARKALRALRGLQGYAEAKASGFAGGLREYLESGSRRCPPG